MANGIGGLNSGGASLQNLDRIRDALINQGIGTSGLAKQAIGRANLPSLSADVATSQATRAAEESKQKAGFGIQKLKQLDELFGLQRQAQLKEQNKFKPKVIGRVQKSQFTPGGLNIAFPQEDGTVIVKTVHTQPTVHEGTAGLAAAKKRIDQLKKLGIDLPSGEKFASGGLVSPSPNENLQSGNTFLGPQKFKSISELQALLGVPSKTFN